MTNQSSREIIDGVKPKREGFFGKLREFFRGIVIATICATVSIIIGSLWGVKTIHNTNCLNGAEHTILPPFFLGLTEHVVLTCKKPIPYKYSNPNNTYLPPDVDPPNHKTHL